MNLVVSMRVSLLVPRMTAIASFCTMFQLSQICDACAIVVRPSL